MRPLKTNAAQIAALRRAIRDNTSQVHCDRCTGKALVARGFAIEECSALQRFFLITDSGRQRARLAADIFGPCASPEAHPDLKDAMRDMPSVNALIAREF